jgi:hypothetical protein
VQDTLSLLRGQALLAWSLVVSTLDVAFLLVDPGTSPGTAYGAFALLLAAPGVGVLALAGTRAAGDQARLRPAARALTAAALAATAGLSGVLLTLSRAVLWDDESVLTAAAPYVGRAALVAWAPIAAVGLVHLWQERRSATTFHPLVRLAAFLSVAAAVLGVVGLVLAPFRSAQFLLGDDLLAQLPAIRQLAYEAGSLGLLTLVTYGLATKHTRTMYLTWTAAIGIVVLGLLRQQDAADAAWFVAAAVLLAASSYAGYALMRSRGFWRDRGPRPVSPLVEQAELDLTFVVPFFNPGNTLRPHLEEMVRVLDATGASYEILPVSDGSTDGSERTLVGLPASVRPIINDTNYGKGHALHVGLNEGRGRYLGFVDADGDIPAELLTGFVQVVLEQAPEIAIGSKKHPDSAVVYPVVRRAYSTGYQWLSRVLFGLSVRDTQTGLKILRRDVLAESLPRMLEKRFAFDLELLVVAHRLGYQDIVELPVVIQERLTSTVSWKSVLRILGDTMAIAYRLRLVGWYDEDPRSEGGSDRSGAMSSGSDGLAVSPS